MSKRLVFLAFLALALVVLGPVVVYLGLATPAHAQGGTTVVPLAPEGGGKNPVVSCIPSAYTTENEEDPFNQTQIRRTHTTVTSVLLVRADGTTEVHKVGN